MKPQFARPHKVLSARPYTNPLKFNHLCRLEPVHGFNLAFLPDNLMFQCLISYIAVCRGVLPLLFLEPQVSRALGWL